METGSPSGHRARWVVVPAVVTLLFVTAFVRLAGVTHEGVKPGDAVNYHFTATKWANGNFEFYRNTYYRPVVNGMNALALIAFGNNEWAIKVLNALLDIASVGLLLYISLRASGNLFVGFAAGIVYALLWPAVDLSRAAMPHSISTFWVLLAVACLVTPRYAAPFSTRRGIFDAVAGVALGMAANTHPDLAFIAPMFVVFIVLQGSARQGFRPAVSTFILRAALLSLGFALPYLAGLIVFGPHRVADVFLREITFHSRPEYVEQTAWYMGPVEFLKVISNHYFERWWTASVLLALPVVATLIRRQDLLRESLYGYVPWLAAIGYGIVLPLVVGSIDESHGRIFLPLVPLVLFSGAWGLWTLVEPLGRKAQYVVPFLTIVGLLFLSPTAATHLNPDEKHAFRWVYDELESRVTDEHRLLIVPSTAYYSRGLQLDFYFGDNAQFLIDQPRTGAYNAALLYAIVREGPFSYVFFQNHIDLRPLTPGVRRSEKHRTWHPDGETYSFDEEVATISQFLAEVRAVELVQSNHGQIYSLRKSLPFPNSDFGEGTAEGWRYTTRPRVGTETTPTETRHFIDTRSRPGTAHARSNSSGVVELSSPPFRIENDLIVVYLTGSSDPERVHVALRTGGTERRIVPTPNRVQYVKWDVAAERGNEAQVFIRDLDPAPERGLRVDGVYYVH